MQVQLEESLPSLKKLLLSTAIALGIAGVILLTIVLPAEYRIDPLGTGKALGLDALSAGAEKIKVTGKEFNTGHYEIKLQSGEQQEHKALVAKNASVNYNWEVRSARGGGAVLFDFHGEPTEGNFPKGYFKSYAEGEGSMSKGTFVAPFTGRHGWYWQNVSGDPVTIVVELAGRFASFDRVDGGANHPGVKQLDPKQ
jgi:hypothetical protein